MKNNALKLFALLVLMTGSVFSVTSCSKNEGFVRRNMMQVNADEGYTDINLTACNYNLGNMPVENLSDAEKNSLLFMREEEKLARDVYLKLLETWHLNVFSNISASEQTHMDAVLMLIEKYQLTDPVGNNGPGVFVNDSLQTLYNDLVALGNSGIVEALQVGALVEEVDIVDLKYALDNIVDNQDIIIVYENLYKASRNHLRAFVRNLEKRGITYVPQRLTQDEYDAIINSDWETGN